MKDLKALSARARALIDAARGGADPDRLSRRRVLDSLLRELERRGDLRR